jgi:NAD(P)-dependent dehydrogenase (short-subunit alcohol dehydrogenase family)
MGKATFDFSGEIALVTGASKGIGREIALQFARSGCGIAAAGRDAADLKSLAEEIGQLGVRCEVRAAELASVEESAALAEHFLEAMAPIDILINNAGTTYLADLVDLDFAHWDRVLDVNLRAPAVISKLVVREMVKRKRGVIINISSSAGEGGIVQHAAYCASKHGLHGLTRVMALELGHHGIRVNAVAPTITLTPLGRQVWGDPVKSKPMLDRIPMGRFAEPEDIAHAVLFLASDQASMIHGEVLFVDGGMNTSI